MTQNYRPCVSVLVFSEPCTSSLPSLNSYRVKHCTAKTFLLNGKYVLHDKNIPICGVSIIVAGHTLWIWQGKGYEGASHQVSVYKCESYHLCLKWYLTNYISFRMNPWSLPEVCKQVIISSLGILGVFCLLLLTSVHFGMICLNSAFTKGCWCDNISWHMNAL